jgi:hypothetical protein
MYQSARAHNKLCTSGIVEDRTAHSNLKRPILFYLDVENKYPTAVERLTVML